MTIGLTAETLCLKGKFVIYRLVLGWVSVMADAGEYKEGQIWKYKTREGEEGSLLYIVKIDEEKGYGKIFHIYLDGLKIKNPYLDSKVQKNLPHAPVDINTLNKSVTELVSENNKMPDISEPYQTWREPFDAGEAGVFNIPVNEIVHYIEDVVN